VVVKIADAVGAVAQMRQEWVTPAEVAQELRIITPSAGRLLADAARDGLLERRRQGARPVVYRIPVEVKP